MNLSETAFATLLSEEGDFESNTKFNLRWFTPTHEINLCGHVILFIYLIKITNQSYFQQLYHKLSLKHLLQATLATAAVIFQKKGTESYAAHY